MRSGLLFSALALAALLPVYAAPHVNFLDFSHTGKPAGVQHATGYPLPVVEYAWRKYGSELIRQVYRYEGFRVAVNSGIRKLADLVAASYYCGLYYIHVYPQVETTKLLSFGRSRRRFSRKKFYACVMPVIFH